MKAWSNSPTPKENSRKSPKQQGHEDIINVNDSEDEDTKEKVEAAPQVVYKKNPEFLYVGKLPKDATKEEMEKFELLKTIEEMAIWLNKVIEHFGIKELSLIGHSQGCLVGLEFAHRFPKLIKSCSRWHPDRPNNSMS